MITAAESYVGLGGPVDANLDTLATAMYVKIDDELKMRPEMARCRPEVGLCLKLSDPELLTFAVIQPFLGFTGCPKILNQPHRHT
jgi:hypothetical protein